MKQIWNALLCVLLLLAMCGCAGEEGGTSEWKEDAHSLPADSTQSAQDSAQRDFSRPEIGLPVEIDPPYDFDPEQMLPQDFGDCFSEDYPVQVSTYKLAEGTDMENEVVVLQGEEDGPNVYIVAGLHGDEIAGWMAGDLLKKASIKGGSLYILSPANPWGASSDPRSRYVTGEEDLNRAFPGAQDGTAAERAAQAIYSDIQRVKPVIVLDLHEARYNMEQRDYLGSSLIFTSLDHMSQMCMDLLQATEMGELCSERFNFFSPGPEGSINRTVTQQLDTPVLTVETYRGYSLERRIGDQLAIVEYVLTYYGLV